MYYFIQKRKTWLVLFLIASLLYSLLTPQPVSASSKPRVKSVRYTNVGKYLTLTQGGKKTLKVTVYPKNAKTKKVKYKSSRSSIVSVSSKGVLKAKRKGTAYITATSKDESKKKDVVKVTVGTRVSSVKYTNLSSKYVMTPGSKKRLKVSVRPSKASNKRIHWSTSRSSVLSVTSKGVIKAKKRGSAYITASARDGSRKKTKYKITVGTRVSRITISGYNYVGEKGSPTKLTANISPRTASSKRVSWKSSNSSIAKVSSSGSVTGVHSGTTTITATATDGSQKKGSYKVHVVKPSRNSAVFVAHRGYSSLAPENTLVAFMLAKSSGFSGVECDLWETKGDTKDISFSEIHSELKQANSAALNAEDVQEQAVHAPEDNTNSKLNYSPYDTDPGSAPEETAKKVNPGLMIMHDQSLKRMCHINRNITDLSPSQLKKHSIISGNNIRNYLTGFYKKGLPIPSYEEYLDSLNSSSHQTMPFIEIKSKTLSPAAAEEIVTLLKEKGMIGHTVIQSFHYDALKSIIQAEKALYASADSGLTLLYLTSSKSGVTSKMLYKYKTLGLEGICIKHTRASASTVTAAKKLGLKVGVWTVDDTTLAYRFAEKYHVDYVISNKKVFR